MFIGSRISITFSASAIGATRFRAVMMLSCISLLRHAGLIVAADDAHLVALQLLGHLAGLFDLLDELVVVLGIVHAGRESPGGELRDVEVQLVAEAARGVDVLAFVRPELDGRKAQRGGVLDPLGKRQLASTTFRR